MERKKKHNNRILITTENLAVQIEEAVKAYIYVYFELVDGAACRIFMCSVCPARMWKSYQRTEQAERRYFA